MTLNMAGEPAGLLPPEVMPFALFSYSTTGLTGNPFHIPFEIKIEACLGRSIFMALSPVAGIQFCNEQQLAQRPVLGSCIPHPDECPVGFLSQLEQTQNVQRRNRVQKE
ncbi:hypothetical protein NQZ68_007690 [Dissostichus eleginoides]|nr:hypothetical protein NQZ68_007690 [Dissostichus eleginoides]